MVPTVYSAH